MSRVCQLSGKKPMVGNNVSRSNKKTKRRFNINLIKKRFKINSFNFFLSISDEKNFSIAFVILQK